MQLFDKNGKPSIVVDVSKAFASGGEGSIMERPQNKAKVIKVYHQPKDLKLESALLELNQLGQRFVKPEEIFYTKTGQIAGFSMRYVDLSQYTILKKLFNNTFCLQNNFDKKVKYKIYQNLKSAVEEAHQLCIVIGDLNPYNILVDKNGDVVLLDTDSYGTKTKTHNGVLLEDIRDWAQHPQVNQSTDQWAFDVLTFWLFALVHPFRGDYPQHKTLEERVCKKSSILSNLPITIPKCYQPFANQDTIDQFTKVFQQGQRFMVNLAGTQTTMPTPLQNLDILNVDGLYIRLLAQTVQRLSISSTQLAILTADNIWEVYSLKDFGVYNKLYTIENAQDIFLGKVNTLYLKNNLLWNLGQEIKNTNNLAGQTLMSENNMLTALNPHTDKLETLALDNLLNGNIQTNQTGIYAKSLQYGEAGMWQTIGANKWILDFKENLGGFNLVKTDFNIKNLYKRGDYALVEHVDQNKTRFTLGKINGLKWETGVDLPEWKYFDVKQGFIFLPEDGKVNLLNPMNNWQIVGSIECPPCKADSRIFHTNAGMTIQTAEGSIYLINKK